LDDVDEIQKLFNAKAGSWDRKYDTKGPLAFRVSVFSGVVARILRPGSLILDFGCGTGAISAELASQGYSVTACDIAEKMIERGKSLHAEQPITWVLLPAGWKKFPFEANSFDAIIASSVFEYLRDPDSVFRECSRILGPGGKLIVSVPDPKHPVRRLERLIRPFSFLTMGKLWARAWPKLANYSIYLRRSQARLSPDEWGQRARRAELSLKTAPDLDTDLAINKALMFLVFERVSSGIKPAHSVLH